MAQIHPFVPQQTLELCLQSQCQVLAGVPCLSPKALNGISILILSLHMLGLFSQCTGMNPGPEKENKNNLQTEPEGTEKPNSHTFGQRSGLLCGLILTASSFHVWSTAARRINPLRTTQDRQTDPQVPLVSRYCRGQKDQEWMETLCQLFGWWWTSPLPICNIICFVIKPPQRPLHTTVCEVTVACYSLNNYVL